MTAPIIRNDSAPQKLEIAAPPAPESPRPAFFSDATARNSGAAAESKERPRPYDDNGLLTGAAGFAISRYNNTGVNEAGLPYSVSNGVLDLNRTFNGYGETGSEDNQVNGQEVYSWGVVDRYADGRMPVAVEKAGATHYLAYDQAGTPRAVADSDGNVVKEITYDSFGCVLSDTNPGFTSPFGFAGGLYDKDTGLVWFG